jgi:hypothetical protein
MNRALLIPQQRAAGVPPATPSCMWKVRQGRERSVVIHLLCDPASKHAILTLVSPLLGHRRSCHPHIVQNFDLRTFACMEQLPLAFPR